MGTARTARQIGSEAAACARSPFSARNCLAAAHRARTACRAQAAARTGGARTTCECTPPRQHAIVARASGLNEAGRAAHLQTRHQNATDDAPGRPMRGDDRCGRSDPHIGSFGVGCHNLQTAGAAAERPAMPARSGAAARSAARVPGSHMREVTSVFPKSKARGALVFDFWLTRCTLGPTFAPADGGRRRHWSGNAPCTGWN